ncbi:hypothetical protein PG994_013444 [Apiospora phragmitis]|uniref:Uncharacterized protein n=1 Tax=Apiospora phragmitis TaxID=2905665 RepID=A0ABR1T8M8_9PEZI
MSTNYASAPRPVDPDPKEPEPKEPETKEPEPTEPVNPPVIDPPTTCPGVDGRHITVDGVEYEVQCNRGKLKHPSRATAFYPTNASFYCTS